jgi:uncharacterized membrane protein (UPF0127 family)
MKLRLKNSVIEAEVADDFFKRMVGLSLSEKKNMFFPMPYESRWSLWMFAVRYPIKMIFISKDKTVIDIKKGVPITTDPKTWKVYTPKDPCMYILETPFNLKIKVGDKLGWQSL